MGRLATFIDAGYLDSLLRTEFGGAQVDYGLLSKQVAQVVGAATSEPLDLLRTFYYSCPPYQSDPPTEEESNRYGAFRKFSAALGYLPRFEVRLGRLQFQGLRGDGSPIFVQKQVDLLLGLDIASLSAKRQITHVALLAGDGDFVPAVKVAKEEGVSVWLFHGPAVSRENGRPTYSRELWQAADDRIEIDSAFVHSVSRRRPTAVAAPSTPAPLDPSS